MEQPLKIAIAALAIAVCVHVPVHGDSARTYSQAPAAAPSSNPYRLSVEFDRKRHLRTVAIGPLWLESDTFHHYRAELTVDFTFEGTQIQTYPAVIRFWFDTYGRESDFLRHSRNKALVLRIGNVEHRLGDAKVKLGTVSPSSHEVASVMVPVATLGELFARVPDNKEATATLGPGRFRLSQGMVAALRHIYLVAIGTLPAKPSN